MNASTVGPTSEVLNSIEPRHLVFDMVYGPQKRRWSITPGNKGPGCGWPSDLALSGVFAFEIWFGKPAPAERMRKALFAAAGRVSV